MTNVSVANTTYEDDIVGPIEGNSQHGVHKYLHLGRQQQLLFLDRIIDSHNHKRVVETVGETDSLKENRNQQGGQIGLDTTQGGDQIGSAKRDPVPGPKNPS